MLDGQVTGHSGKASTDQIRAYRARAAYHSPPKCKSVTEEVPLGGKGTRALGSISTLKAKMKPQPHCPGHWFYIRQACMLFPNLPDKVPPSPKGLCFECNHQMLKHIQICTFQRASYIPGYEVVCESLLRTVRERL